MVGRNHSTVRAYRISPRRVAGPTAGIEDGVCHGHLFVSKKYDGRSSEGHSTIEVDLRFADPGLVVISRLVGREGSLPWRPKLPPRGVQIRPEVAYALEIRCLLRQSPTGSNRLY